MRTDNTIIKKQHIYYFDLLRISACLMVIFNHTGEHGFDLYWHSSSIIQFSFYAIPSIICKSAVPIFFMISGALLLNDKENLIYILKHRVTRIVVVLFLSNICYYLRELYYSHGVFSLTEFFLRTYSSQWTGPLWYLYAYISVLIAIPFLYPLVKNIERKYIVWLILLVIFFEGLIPMLEFLITNDAIKLNSSLTVSWLSDWNVLYPVLGYLLSKTRIEHVKKYRPYWQLGGGIAVLLTILSLYVKTTRAGFDLIETDLENIIRYFVLPVAIALFFQFRLMDEIICKNKKLCLGLKCIGKYTFGVYLLHVWVKNTAIVSKLWIVFELMHVNQMIAAGLFCIIVFLICSIITAGLKKIPGIKKII